MHTSFAYIMHHSKPQLMCSARNHNWKLIRYSFSVSSGKENVWMFSGLIGRVNTMEANLSNLQGKLVSVPCTLWGGCVICFLRIPQAIGLYCSCHAALSSKGNYQKTYYKTFGTSGRPTWYNDVFLQENELHLGIFENQGNTRIWHLGKCVIHPQNS